MIDERKYDYEYQKMNGTGGVVNNDNLKEINYSINKYDLTVQVSESGQFVGISEIKVNTDFMSDEQRLSNQNYHDVEKYYEEDVEE